MQEKQLNMASDKLGKPLGGWLWVIMIMLVASCLQNAISVATTTSELLSDDWNNYFYPTDGLLRTRIHIYLYLIISMVIGIAIMIWCLWLFFKRMKKFPVIFLGLLGYLILIEILRIYLLDYYAALTDQDARNMDSGLLKTGLIAIIFGLYLNKGRRPIQTFVN